MPKSIILGVVGNKKDLIENINEINELNQNEYVEKEEGEKFANELGALFSQTSAKDDPEGFIDFVRQLIYKYVSEQGNIEQNREIIHINNNQIKKKKCC